MSHKRTRSATSKASTIDSSITRSTVSSLGRNSDDGGTNSESNRKARGKSPTSPGGSREGGTSPYGAGGAKRKPVPRDDLNESEWDLSAKLELARKNSESAARNLMSDEGEEAEVALGSFSSHLLNRGLALSLTRCLFCSSSLQTSASLPDLRLLQLPRWNRPRRPLRQGSPRQVLFAFETRLQRSRRRPSSNPRRTSSLTPTFVLSLLPSLKVSRHPSSLEHSPQSNRNVPSALAVQLPLLQQQSPPPSLSPPRTLDALLKPPSGTVSAPPTPKSDSCLASRAIDESATNGGKLDHPSLPVQLPPPPQLFLPYQSPKTLQTRHVRPRRRRGEIEQSRWRLLRQRWARNRNERRRKFRGRLFFLGLVETRSGMDRRRTWLGRIRA